MGFLFRRKQRPRILSVEARTTLSNNFIYQFGNSLSNIFIDLYLWRLTNDLWVNGVYTLITLLSGPIATMWMGKLSKQRDRLIAYRLCIYLTALF